MSIYDQESLSTVISRDNLVASISEQTARINRNFLNRSPRLRKQNRVKTIVGTLAIEGNALNTEQVTAIIEGKPVLGRQREIAEVKGAIKAYESLESWEFSSQSDLLRAHQIMMGDILKDAGRFREKAAGIYQGDKVVHFAPQAGRVPDLMNDLLLWSQNSDHHPLIVSSAFHYELEFIHPFSDGNGRLGRLWQTLILGKWKELFYFLPLESVIKDRQSQYYEALSKADKKGDSVCFIEFMLEAIRAALNQNIQTSDYVKKLLAVMNDDWLNLDEIMLKLGLRHKPTFRKNYLKPALTEGLVIMRYPDLPRSPKQKYRKV